jgi:O-antigen ligase
MSKKTAQAKNQPVSKRQHAVDYLLLVIVGLMPFHAFLVTALGTHFGHETIFQAWKEVVLVIMVALVASLYSQKQLIERLRRPVNLTIVVFAVLALLISVFAGAIHQSAFWFGVKTDLEFLLIFILAQFTSAKLQKLAVLVLLCATTIVAAFGVLQVTVLPINFLAQFGYGPNTILPFELVNPAVPAVRILSTLGGPNQLGSFLILPICLMVYYLIKRRWIWLLPLAASIYALWHTYSRSAEIGLAISLLLMLFITLKPRVRFIALGMIVVAGVVVGVLGRNAVLSSRTVQAYLFHGDIRSNQVFGSDAAHLASVKQGLSLIGQQPLGRGLGTAGPASYHGSSSIITEDYYLQIGIETGLIGLLLFGVITVLTGVELFKLSDSALMGLPILGALAGLTISNFFLHTWADSSTALT